MDKKLTIMLAIIILVFIALGFIFGGHKWVGNVIKSFADNQENDTYKHSFTKAICNESNYCQDYEIECENNELAEIRPITGAVVQHSDDWVDPRDEQTKNKMCE